MAENKTINKTMDPLDLKTDEAQKIIKELNQLIVFLKEKDIKISSWYGCFDLSGRENSSEVINRGYNYQAIENAIDDKNFPWFLYWEIVWVLINANITKGQKVLDLGGSSSLFSYYLASKGIDVTTVDLQEDLVNNANRTAQLTNWNLKNYAMDMRDLDFDCQFDHITSICVFEHIPMYNRIKINKLIKKFLVHKGRFSITIDFRNPSRLASIDTPKDVYEQFVVPSGLNIRGNEQFFDSGESYLLHPFYYPGISRQYQETQIKNGHFDPKEFSKSKQENDYTFGALFLEKTE